MHPTDLLLREALLKNNLTLSDNAVATLLNYLALLTKWNRVFNLTSITDIKEMIYLHLVDSLVLHPYLKGKRIADIGSGAGLPGIPLAILHPEQHFTLVDKNNKKTRFLTQVVAELKLTNITVVHQSSEDFHPSHCFDTIISRAFGTIRTFIEATQHLLCPYGILLAMKGQYPKEELDDIPNGFVAQHTVRLDIQGIAVKRHVICLRRKK